MSTVDQVIEQVTNPSPTAQRSRSFWEGKPDDECLAACQQALYGIVEPVLFANAKGEQLPVDNPDKLHEITGLFEATIAKFQAKSSRSMSSSN